MSLIQLFKFKEVEAGLYIIPYFEMPHFQNGGYSCLRAQSSFFTISKSFGPLCFSSLSLSRETRHHATA